MAVEILVAMTEVEEYWEDFLEIIQEHFGPDNL